MSTSKRWGLLLSLAAALSVPPSYAQDQNDATDPAIDAAEGDVLVQNEPGRPGVIKITYICRAHKGGDHLKKGGKPSPPPPSHIANCEDPAEGFLPWGYIWGDRTDSVTKQVLPVECLLYTKDSNVEQAKALGAVLNSCSSWIAAQAAGTTHHHLPPPMHVTLQDVAARPPSRKMDGKNVISWGALSGSTLAVTQIWVLGTTILEFDMTLNKNVAWKVYPGPVDPLTCGKLGPEYDVEDTVAHEAGHAYGLTHPVGSDGTVSSANPRLTMYYAGDPGQLHGRTLNVGDIAGIQAIY